MADIDIINSALVKLGEQPLVAVSDPSVPGRLANRTYADLRDALLVEFPWNFAIKRASLAADPTTPEWGFNFSYNFPSDLLRLVSINNESDMEWANEGRAILTDIEAPLEIKYVANVPTEKMDATFRDALAARLAMEWAEPLSQTTSVGQQMATLYRNKLGVARTADGQQDRIQRIDAPDFINARFEGNPALGVIR